MTLEMWWPHPDSLKDLTVNDSETGFDLSAPDDTECGDWLKYWNQSEEHQKFFSEQFVKVLINQLEKFDGQTQTVPDEQNCNRAETETNVSG